MSLCIFSRLCLHVATSLQSSVAPPPSPKAQTQRPSGLLSRFVAAFPRLHSPLVHLTSTWLFTQADLKRTLVVSSRYASTFPIPVLGINWLCLWNVLFFKLSLSFFFFSSKSLVFLDATWKCHPLYLFSVKCKPFRCDCPGLMMPLFCLPEHASPGFPRMQDVPLVVHKIIF